MAATRKYVAEWAGDYAPLRTQITQLSGFSRNVLGSKVTLLNSIAEPTVWGVMKVLIVDDSEPMRRMIKSLISDLVGEVCECSDGSEVMAAYQEHRPDLVLMDVQMTGMDGLAATRQIKKSFPEARIVMVSQWEDPPLRKAARLAGAEAYVGKSDLEPLRRILTNE